MNASPIGPDARGPLPASPAGAAALYRAAELSACPAHSLMTLVHASPADVARVARGQNVPEGQSPLAIARGVRFENRLAADGGARLREALRPVSPRAATGPMLNLHADVPMPPSGAGRAAALLERERRTLAALRGRGPAVVWQAALTVRIGPTAFRVKPDMLMDTGRAYAVGEVKSYPDRGPRPLSPTSPARSGKPRSASSRSRRPPPLATAAAPTRLRCSSWPPWDARAEPARPADRPRGRRPVACAPQHARGGSRRRPGHAARRDSCRPSRRRGLTDRLRRAVPLAVRARSVVPRPGGEARPDECACARQRPGRGDAGLRGDPPVPGGPAARGLVVQ
jgi:hypothetical protein